MRIGFTGTRKGMTPKQEELFLDFVKSLKDITEFHHGDCLGADAQADELMRSVSSQYKIIVHPPANDRYRAWCDGDITLPEEEYLERNHSIVNAIDLLIACPGSKSEELRSGTWATVRYARKRGKKVAIIYPEGDIYGETELG